MIRWLPLLMSCTADPDIGALRPAGERAIRASMALRGVRPTPAELDRVRQDPAALDDLVDAWLDDPAFLETMRDLHAETLWLRTDTQTPLPPLGPLAGRTRGEIHGAVSEAPLHLVAHLVASGRPYTELVTTERTVANDVLVALYGLQPGEPAPGLPDGWGLTRWTDGRAAAGLLSDNGMWLRHISSDTNHHRTRANQVLRALLCEDLSERDLGVLGLDLTDLPAVADTVGAEPGCAACHDILDPVAAVFWGYRRYVTRAEVASAYASGCADPAFCYPLAVYDPSHRDGWDALGLPAPAWFGEPLVDAADLGRAVAADPRFAQCTARRFAAWFSATELSSVDSSLVEILADGFVESGYDAKALARAIVTDPSFQGADAPPIPVRPEQYARMLEDLTGFRWTVDPDAPDCEDRSPTCWGPVDLLADDRVGFRVLAGGIDGYDVRRPQHRPTPTRALALQEAALQAAGFVVDRDGALPHDRRRLLGGVDLTSRDPSAVRAGLALLHRRILGEEVAPVDLALQPTVELWEDAHARTGDPTHAWKLAIAGLLIDPRAWHF